MSVETIDLRMLLDKQACSETLTRCCRALGVRTGTSANERRVRLDEELSTR
jgi:hypothetical protein